MICSSNLFYNHLCKCWRLECFPLESFNTFCIVCFNAGCQLRGTRPSTLDPPLALRFRLARGRDAGGSQIPDPNHFPDTEILKYGNGRCICFLQNFSMAQVQDFAGWWMGMWGKMAKADDMQLRPMSAWDPASRFTGLSCNMNVKSSRCSAVQLLGVFLLNIVYTIKCL